MSVAGLRYAGAQQWGHSAPAETKSGSYMYAGSASAYHDWEFRTRVRVLQHKEKQKRELLKDLRITALSEARSQSPRKWGPRRAGATEYPGFKTFRLRPDLAGGIGRSTEGESSGIPASPSSARRRPTTPDEAADAEDDGEAGSIPSHPHPSQIEGEEDDLLEESDRAYTAPVLPTMADVPDKDVDMSECVSKILEGLRGDAFSIARNIGLERLLQHDGIDHLIEQIRQQAFPLQSEEASELFRQGQLLSGPLAKQQGEPMLSYIARRKRWWSTLCELDPDIRLSEATRANLLVELSGLTRQEQLMVKTAARSQTTDEYARVLVQHHSVVHMKERLLTEKPSTQRTGYKPRNDRQHYNTPKFGYIGCGYDEHDAAEPDQGTIPEEDFADAAYPALVDEVGEEYAEAVQLAYAATNTAYIDMRTCKKCGTVTKTKKEKPVVDQSTSLHGVTEQTGSSRKTSRLKCKLCGMLLDEQPQYERKKRSEIASVAIDFDLLRSIASHTSEDLPVEVVVPAIDQFRETVEGHFVTEPSITRDDLIAYLQEAIEDQLPQESHNTSWEMASAGARSQSSRLDSPMDREDEAMEPCAFERS
ncbi:hypothetical protein AK812_SmicGene42525 [Symbiodinium microadriaticum]|uniref:Uncharacterized protein n=1 Tax=Symbiodinium microadriaticum TaxID=2951 RepID=A0A1Q9C3C1_SYMMI|nr:hypothetical protein AK812_SmicGene42525 [Symbiodinium microadriaticum]